MVSVCGLGWSGTHYVDQPCLGKKMKKERKKRKERKKKKVFWLGVGLCIRFPFSVLVFVGLEPV